MNTSMPHLAPPAPEGHDPHTGHLRHEGGHHTATHEESGGGHAGHHDGHAGHGADHAAMFRRLFWLMLVLAVPVVAASATFAMILGYSPPDVAWVAWVSPVLGTVMYLWGGRPFLTGAIDEIRVRRPGMMLLVGLAISVAFVASWGATLGVLDDQLDFWWELALLIVIMLLGHWHEMRSLAQTTSALDSLAALLPDEAERVEGGEIVIVAPTAAGSSRRVRGSRSTHSKTRTAVPPSPSLLGITTLTEPSGARKTFGVSTPSERAAREKSASRATSERSGSANHSLTAYAPVLASRRHTWPSCPRATGPSSRAGCPSA